MTSAYAKMFCKSILYEYIEDIYFFEVNINYISSNVLKISVFPRMRSTSEMMMFSTQEMKYVWYLSKKVNFLLILYLRELRISDITRVNFVCFIVLSVCNIGCKRSLHLEICAECHFNEWITVNRRLKEDVGSDPSLNRRMHAQYEGVSINS